LSFDQQGSIVGVYAGVPSLMNIFYEELNKRVFYSGADPVWEDVDKTIHAILSEIRQQHTKDMEDIGQQFLFGISTPYMAPSLFSAHLDLLSPASWAAIGIGDSSLVRYLVGRFWKVRMSIEQALLLAVYIVNQAKEYVDKCGGKTESCIIQSRGHVRRFGGPTAEPLNHFVNECESLTVHLLSAWGDRQSGDFGFDLALKSFGRRMKELRQVLYSTSSASQS
jgi:20S proteasome alpha/beta subunit